MSALKDQLRAQAELMQECRRRAVAARDPRMASALTDIFIRLCDAMTETAFVSGSLGQAGTLGPLAVVLLANLRLPKLPDFPEEGEGPPRGFCKTTAGGIQNEISGLEAWLSSPACGEVDRRAAARR